MCRPMRWRWGALAKWSRKVGRNACVLLNRQARKRRTHHEPCRGQGLLQTGRFRLPGAFPSEPTHRCVQGEKLMCGIVGILGREQVADHLIDALKRLEYRGYDSAGVATLENGQLARRRAEGKLKNLERRLEREPLNGTSGIGHTRWATHGRPTENNAHPHATERL